MKWNGKHPVVRLVEGNYQIGVKLTKKAVQFYESMIERLPLPRKNGLLMLFLPKLSNSLSFGMFYFF